MTLRYLPYTLNLKAAFILAHGTRSSTPAVLTRVDFLGISGFGEASLPPYLGETVESVSAFLAQIDLRKFSSRFVFEDALRGIQTLGPGNNAAKAAVDIALHDWVGKTEGFSWYQHWDLDPVSIPPTSYTIAIDTPESIRLRVAEVTDFRFLKVKLGGRNDEEIIKTVREESDQVIRVDVNEGWTDRYKALDMIGWLSEKRVELVEQPMPRDRVDDAAWLAERSPLPIVADEAVCSVSDISSAQGVYHGINVKLMKCGGMAEAHRMIQAAKARGLKVMLGCMTETSCGISAAAQLAPLADWVDLDGALLIKNDPFRGVRIEKGRILLPQGFGIGIEQVSEALEFPE